MADAITNVIDGYLQLNDLYLGRLFYNINEAVCWI